MKKTFVFIMLMWVSLCNAQIITGVGGDRVRLDYNGDGIWDTEVSVRGIPNSGYMRCGYPLANELGRLYVLQIWNMYNQQGINPASQGIPNPNGEGNFSQYAGYYLPYVGMCDAYVGGYGIPGQAGLSIGTENFGFGISVPVGGGYTPNASVGVRVGGTHVGVSLPTQIFRKKKSVQQQRQQPTQQQRTTNINGTPTRVVEMSVDEIQQMVNDDLYL